MDCVLKCPILRCFLWLLKFKIWMFSHSMLLIVVSVVGVIPWNSHSPEEGSSLRWQISHTHSWALREFFMIRIVFRVNAPSFYNEYASTSWSSFALSYCIVDRKIIVSRQILVWFTGYLNSLVQGLFQCPLTVPVCVLQRCCCNKKRALMTFWWLFSAYIALVFL